MREQRYGEEDQEEGEMLSCGDDGKEGKVKRR